MRRKPKKERPRRKKICKLCMEKVEIISYQDIRMLKNFTTERGKIIPRRVSGNCPKHQRSLTESIKRARILALIPFVAE